MMHLTLHYTTLCTTLHSLLRQKCLQDRKNKQVENGEISGESEREDS
jgi:hypothetical protein